MLGGDAALCQITLTACRLEGQFGITVHVNDDCHDDNDFNSLTVLPLYFCGVY